MTDEQRLIERLRLVEALHAGAATPGERDAAAEARNRILDRLKNIQRDAPPIEYTFTLRNSWSKKLFLALLRRYQLRPYRYPRQRQTTVMVRVPEIFVNETLWPEFVELNKSLVSYLNDVTDRVIRESMQADASEPEVRSEPQALTAPPASGSLEQQD